MTTAEIEPTATAAEPKRENVPAPEWFVRPTIPPALKEALEDYIEKLIGERLPKVWREVLTDQAMLIGDTGTFGLADYAEFISHINDLEFYLAGQICDDDGWAVAYHKPGNTAVE